LTLPICDLYYVGMIEGDLNGFKKYRNNS
jgi:hypothetical protein